MNSNINNHFSKISFFVFFIIIIILSFVITSHFILAIVGGAFLAQLLRPLLNILIAKKVPAQLAAYLILIFFVSVDTSEMNIVKMKIKIILYEGKLARDLKLSAEDMALVKDMQLLTWKPIFYVLNIHEKNTLELSSRVSSRVNSVAVDIKIEEELSQMSANESAELGMKSNLDKLILKSYEVLNLITFLTTGEDETRAWTVKYDSTAPEAGRAIHSDFEEKFIRADVINWQKLLEAGSWAKARELGTLRTEGKDYIVKDGDVIEFKI